MPALDSIRDLLNDIRGQKRRLPADEEFALIKRAQAGDVEARDTLVVCNISYVVNRALKFHLAGLQDNVQNGVLGILTAIERYDTGKINPKTQRPYDFRTYAGWWVRSYIGSNLLKSPEVSLDVPIDEDRTYADVLEGGDDPVHNAFISDVQGMLPLYFRDLSEREESLLRLRFGIDDGVARKLQEIGDIFGCTRENVRQHEVKALRKVRRTLESCFSYSSND